MRFDILHFYSHYIQAQKLKVTLNLDGAKFLLQQQIFLLKYLQFEHPIKEQHRKRSCRYCEKSLIVFWFLNLLPHQ